MTTVLHGEVHVHYGQIYVEGRASEFGGDMSATFAGQSNGLCGAGVPGMLFLITGLHTGQVGFSVEVLDEEPPLADSWEEVVEVSFRPPTPHVALVEWGGGDSYPLGLQAIDYRVRYCGVGMDAARDADTVFDDEEPVDRYLLQFWPSPPRPDAVLKETSAAAAYWHKYARELPPPPTPEERAEAERVRKEEQRRALELRARQAELKRWGGTLPSERLRRLRGNAFAAATLDRDLAELIAASSPEHQRQAARWIARRAYTRADLADVPWISPALAALDRGEALPAPFDAHEAVWDRFFNDPAMPSTTVTSLDGRHDNLLQQAAAIPSIFEATLDDPLEAALTALYAAAVAFGRDHYRTLLTELRASFD
ncbi:hypothetical protein ACPZ19_31340 [Amycolatopsis lurida]